MGLKLKQSTNKNQKLKAGKLAQQLRVYTILAEDQNLVPSFYIRQLTPTCDSSSRGSQCHILASASTQMQVCTCV